MTNSQQPISGYGQQRPTYPTGPYDPAGAGYPPPPSYAPPMVPHQRQPGPPYGPQPGFGQPPPAVPPLRRRKGSKARTAVLIVVIPLVLFVALAGLGALIGPKRAPAGTPQANAPQPGSIVEAGTLSASFLEPGDCFSTKQAPPQPGAVQPVSTVEAVPCTSPHTSQIVSDYDGNGSAGCEAVFQKKLVSSAFGDKSISFGHLEFTSSSSGGTPIKTVTGGSCVVFSQQPITRSLLK